MILKEKRINKDCVVGMPYTYLLYFSNELNGRGYNIGSANFSRFVDIVFHGLDVVSTKEKDRVYTVVCNHRFVYNVDDKNACSFKYKSGITVRPYIMAELS